MDSGAPHSEQGMTSMQNEYGPSSGHHDSIPSPHHHDGPATNNNNGGGGGGGGGGGADDHHNNNNNNNNNNSNTSTNIIGSAHLRPVFLGNLDYNCTGEDLEELFTQPINGERAPVASVDRVDAKRGFGFVFLNDAKCEEDKERVERYVEGINGMNIPKLSKQIRAEFARGDGRIKRKEDDRRKNIIPSPTLFVVGFNEETTKREDLEMLFAPFGEIVRIDMKRNYAFVQFTKVDDSTKAKDETNGGKLDQSVITVEYAQNVGERMSSRGGGRFRGDRDRYDRRRSPPRGRYDDDRGRGGYRDRSPPQGRYDDYRRGGGRDRSPPPPYPRDRYDDYRRGGAAGRSRSRSPIYRYRSRSRSPRGGRNYDDFNGSRGAPDGPAAARENREYRGGEGFRGRSADREYRGYK